MNKHYFLLAIFSMFSAIEAKRPTLAGLANQSDSIYTPDQRKTYSAYVGAGMAALCGGIARFCAEASTQNQILAASAGALIGSAGLYLSLDTPEDVAKRAVRGLQEQVQLINSLHANKATIIYQVRLTYVQAEFPLIHATRVFKGLIEDFNLFVDMMENRKISSQMSVSEFNQCVDLVPVFEDALVILSNALIVVTSDAGYADEYERYTARMAALAARDSAYAHQQAAHAHWMHVLEHYHCK